MLKTWINTVGHVIHLNNMFEVPDYHEYKHMLCGDPQRLISKFKVHFSIILKLISTQETNFSQFIEQSMMNDETKKDIKYMNMEIEAYKEKSNELETSLSLIKTDIETIKEYHNLKSSLHTMKQKRRKNEQRRLRQMAETSRTFEKDYDKYLLYLKNEYEINKTH